MQYLSISSFESLPILLTLPRLHVPPITIRTVKLTKLKKIVFPQSIQFWFEIDIDKISLAPTFNINILDTIFVV